jgi:hypothetical protein
MNGAGHIQDMINRLKNNRNQLRSQRRGNAKDRLEYKSNILFSEPEVCPEKLKKVKQKIKANALEERKKTRMLNLILILISLFIVLCGLGWFISKRSGSLF